MHRTTALTLGLCLTFAASGAANAGELFKANLSGEEEVPPVMTDTSGQAFFLLNNAETEIRFLLRVRKGEGITQAHIHCGAFGETGDPAVFLAGNHPAGLDVDGKWISSATITEDSILDTDCGASISELAESMRQGDTYVNVHSIANPPGEVRGQIESIW